MTLTAGKTRLTVGTLFAAAVILLLVYDTRGTAQLSLCAATVHELGHIGCLAAFSQPPAEISLGAFGMRIRQGDGAPLSYAREAAAAFAGPAANLLLALLLYIISQLTGAYVQMRVCVCVNVFLALFNLLPVEPLDGGKVISCLLCIFIDSERARKVSKITAAVGISLLTAAGIFVFVVSGYNFTLIVAAVYLLVCLLSDIN